MGVLVLTGRGLGDDQKHHSEPPQNPEKVTSCKPVYLVTLIGENRTQSQKRELVKRFDDRDAARMYSNIRLYYDEYCIPRRDAIDQFDRDYGTNLNAQLRSFRQQLVNDFKACETEYHQRYQDMTEYIDSLIESGQYHK